MGFLGRLFPNLGKSQSKGKAGYTTTDGPHGLWFYVRCDKCDEKIAVRLRTTSEVQKREGPDEELGLGHYFVKKTIVGSNCYQRIEATVDFDVKYNVVDSAIHQGQLITYEEFNKKDEQ